jgi:hypothetical protein
MAFFDFLKDYQSNAARGRELRGRQEASRGRFGNIVENIMQRGQDLSDAPTLTAQDLFADEIQNLQDNARANANATKSALSRSLLAGGGDPSGASATDLLRTDQSTNQQMGQITDRFNQLATRINERRKSRGDSFISQALQGRQNLMSADTKQLMNFVTREAQKETANRQKNSSLFGNLLSTAGSVAGAAILACWVAEELYPEDPKKVEQVRDFLSNISEDDEVLVEFTKTYQLHGDEWADEIKKHPEVKRSAKRLFDEFYELSKAA